MPARLPVLPLVVLGAVQLFHPFRFRQVALHALGGFRGVERLLAPSVQLSHATLGALLVELVEILHGMCLLFPFAKIRNFPRLLRFGMRFLVQFHPQDAFQHQALRVLLQLGQFVH